MGERYVLDDVSIFIFILSLVAKLFITGRITLAKGDEMKNVVILFLLLALPSLGLAVEAKVTGAFGFKFGETCDERKVLYVGKSENGSLYYTVTPKNTFRSLNTYVLAMTPKTKKIYAVNAFGLFNDAESCKRETRLIAS